MLTEFLGGARMAARHWISAFSMSAMLAVGSLVLSFSLGDLLSQAQVLEGGQSLRNAHAVTFSTYYQPEGVSRLNPQALSALVTQIEKGRAYTMLVNNAGIDTDNPDMTLSPVVLIGDAVQSLFPYLSLCSPAPCAMRGANVTPQMAADSPRVVKDQVPFGSVLRAGAVLFDPNAAGLELDNRVILRLPASSIKQFGEIESEEVLTRAVMLKPSSSDVRDYVSLAAKNDLGLIPHDVATDQPQRFNEVLARSGLYILGVIGFLFCVVASFAGVLKGILSRERKAFIIRRWYGATDNDIGQRIAGFMFCAALLLPSALLVPVALLRGPWTVSSVWVLGCLVGVSLFLWATNVRRVVSLQAE